MKTQDKLTPHLVQVLYTAQINKDPELACNIAKKIIEWTEKEREGSNIKLIHESGEKLKRLAEEVFFHARTRGRVIGNLRSFTFWGDQFEIAIEHKKRSKKKRTARKKAWAESLANQLAGLSTKEVEYRLHNADYDEIRVEDSQGEWLILEMTGKYIVADPVILDEYNDDRKSEKIAFSTFIRNYIQPTRKTAKKLLDS